MGTDRRATTVRRSHNIPSSRKGLPAGVVRRGLCPGIRIEQARTLIVIDSGASSVPRLEEKPSNVDTEIQRLRTVLDESRHQRLKIEKNREKLRRAIARLQAKAVAWGSKKPAPESEAGSVQENDG